MSSRGFTAIQCVSCDAQFEKYTVFSHCLRKCRDLNLRTISPNFIIHVQLLRLMISLLFG